MAVSNGGEVTSGIAPESGRMTGDPGRREQRGKGCGSTGEGERRGKWPRHFRAFGETSRGPLSQQRLALHWYGLSVLLHPDRLRPHHCFHHIASHL